MLQQAGCCVRPASEERHCCPPLLVCAAVDQPGGGSQRNSILTALFSIMGAFKQVCESARNSPCFHPPIPPGRHQEDAAASPHPPALSNARRDARQREKAAAGRRRRCATWKWLQARATHVVAAASPLASCVQETRAEPSEESIRRTLDYLHEKAKGSTAVTVTESEAVRPMMEVRSLARPPWTLCGAHVRVQARQGTTSAGRSSHSRSVRLAAAQVVWAPLLGALSVLFDEYVEPRHVGMCLQGISASLCLAALVSRASLRRPPPAAISALLCSAGQCRRAGKR